MRRVDSIFSGRRRAPKRDINAALLADWVARSTDSGVFRFTKFSTDAVVNAYRFTNGIGHDPSPAPGSVGSFVRRNPTGGIMGDGCLELEQITNGNMSSIFWLPFDASKATYEYNNTGYTRGVGQEFYFQIRVKTNCGGQSSVGGGGRKMFSVSTLTHSYTAQELVVQDTLYRGIAQMYQGVGVTGGGDEPYKGFEEGVPPFDFNLQPGSQHAVSPAFCSYSAGDYVNQAACWPLFNGEWITYLMHVIPGADNTPNGTVELFGHKNGMSNYVRLMQKLNFTMRYDGDKAHMFNAAPLWIYETGRTSGPAGQMQWYDEAILSTSYIPPPISVS